MNKRYVMDLVASIWLLRYSVIGFTCSPQGSQGSLSKMQILSLNFLSLHDADQVFARCPGVFLHLWPHATTHLWWKGPKLLHLSPSSSFSASPVELRTNPALPRELSSAFTLFWTFFLPCYSLIPVS